MQKYSLSQQKMIEVPDVQPTGQATQQTPSTGGLNTEAIRQATQADLINGGKNYSVLSRILELQPKEPAPLTPAEKEAKVNQTNDIKQTIGNIDTVLGKNLSTVSGVGGVVGLIPGTKSFTTRGEIQQIRDQLSLASVGKLKGQGQVSDAERALLANSVSNIKFGMSPEDLKAELIKVKGILSSNIGEAPTPNPEVTGGDNLNLPGMALSGADALSKFLFPSTRKAFSPEGIQTANPLTAHSGDMSKTKGNLGESLKATGNDLLGYLGLVAPAGVEVGVAASTLPKAASKGKAIVEGTKTFTTKGAIANRTALATESTAEHSGGNIIKAAEEYVANDPTAKKLLEKITPTLENKTLDSSTLLEKLKIWNKAYSAAGRVGNSSKAGLYDTLARAAKEELAANAPDVLAANTKLAQAYGREKVLNKIINPTTLATGGVTAGTYALLNKILGLGKGMSQ